MHNAKLTKIHMIVVRESGPDECFVFNNVGSYAKILDTALSQESVLNITIQNDYDYQPEPQLRIWDRGIGWNYQSITEYYDEGIVRL